MPYDLQTNALLPYFLLAAAYVGILLFPRRTRDVGALVLLVLFCLALGFRNIDMMPDGADPVTYASLLANDAPPYAEALLGGTDYALFSLLRHVTGSALSLGGAFFMLHLLYLPFLFLLYRVCRAVTGMFYLLAGWMLFVNSGVLLLCNFFRQGISVLLFLAVLISFSKVTKAKWVRWLGAVGLPFLHFGAAAFAPGLFMRETRRHLWLFSAYFFVFCLAIWAILERVGFGLAYFDEGDLASHQSQLLTKVAVTYVILLVGMYLRKYFGKTADSTRNIQNAALVFLVPTAALLLTYNAPIIGLRFVYYSHAVAFAYLASGIAAHRRSLAVPLAALGICCSGIITWTYPTVSMLLVW